MLTSNLLLIAGTGNKSGKTTLACRVIGQFRNHGVMAIKITPHFHETTPGLQLLSEGEGFSVFKETDSLGSKDTSRMLRAGAAMVFFAKVTDNNLLNAFNEVMSHIPAGTPVVCESPALRNYTDPGVFVIMKSTGEYNNKNINDLLSLPHIMMQLADLEKMDSLPFSFSDGKWEVKQDQ